MSIVENKSSGEIERDVEQTRADMTETLDELRARMSPGKILDEVLSYTTRVADKILGCITPTSEFELAEYGAFNIWAIAQWHSRML
ncbi:DUF3618 domain-containing protein [Mesorhizobium sp. BAC0120]|uniref:DUF3618 domain-containing protein n=1 Tax=Mesorhizobium sp. BAC0120 TaxID=3090670 RepID=UPI00298BEE54|nr:DUF3618 domain-containing protein [Mesorhizobium sp. BAC0120]MDW6025901.1 DUF3618 domain-containing protein [Mesorhizobium sp. BAC0120]